LKLNFLPTFLSCSILSLSLSSGQATGKREKERKRKNKSTIHGPEAGRLFLFLSLFSSLSSTTGQEERGKEGNREEEQGKNK